MKKKITVNAQVKALWVDALRSGEYIQGKGQLRNKDKFCCLGVLCNLHAQNHPEIAAMQKRQDDYMGYDGSLPPAVRLWADIAADPYINISGQVRSLSYHNDHTGASFSEIADAIEEQL